MFDYNNKFVILKFYILKNIKIFIIYITHKFL